VLEGGQLVDQAACPAALRQLFWLLLVLLSAIIVFWAARLGLAPRTLGRSGRLVGAFLWMLGGGTTILMLVHLVRVIIAEMMDGNATLSSVEVFVLVSFAAFGVLQGTQHFLYKLKGRPDGRLDSGLRPRWNAAGGLIAGELRRLSRRKALG
jgi:hypothetical protein